jgi:hypothetical protein
VEHEIMGCDLLAYLLIDDNSGPERPAFSNAPSIWDLRRDQLFGCKDYDFYAAIAGIRNRFGKPPLIPPRGAVSHDRFDPMERLDRGCVGVGWLTLSEIDEAMRHMNIHENERPEPVRRVLAVMRLLENRLGKDRVRLVFGFAD